MPKFERASTRFELLKTRGIQDTVGKVVEDRWDDSSHVIVVIGCDVLVHSTGTYRGCIC